MVNTTIQIVKTHNATYYVDFDEGEIYVKNRNGKSGQIFFGAVNIGFMSNIFS